MKGTAILYQKGQTVTIIEDVDRKVFDQIKDQCGSDHCNCHFDNKMVDFGSVSPVFWHEEDVDWDYGY